MRKFLTMVATVAVALMISVVPVMAEGCKNVCPAKCKDDSGKEVNCDGVPTNLLSNTNAPDGTKCYCANDPNRGSAIGEILVLVLNIFSGVVMTLAVVGIVIAGVQYLSARDNDAQVAKAKNRLLQIVIGLVAYVLMWAFLNWLVPGGVFN